MSEKWVQVSPAQARQHRLYGIKGWLVFFLVALLLSFLLFLSQSVGGIASAKLDWATFSKLNPNLADFLLFSGIFNLAVVLAIFALALLKCKKFRVIATVLLTSIFPVQFIFTLVFPFAGAGAALGQDAIAWLVSYAVWISYLQFSRRVRVTYEGKVHFSEAKDAGASLNSTRDSQLQHSHILSHELARDTSTNSVSFQSQGKALSGAASESSIPIARRTQNLGEQSTGDNSVAHPSDTSDSEVWGLVLDEYEGNARDRSLYARLFAKYDGDEQKTKAAYLKQRVAAVCNEQAAHRAAAQLQSKRATEEALREMILKRTWATFKFEGVEFLSFSGDFSGFLLRRRCFVFDDRDAMLYQYKQVTDDPSWAVSGHVFVYQLEDFDNATCLAAGKYSKEWAKRRSYYQLFNGNVALILMRRIYVFDRLDILLEATEKNREFELSTEVYDLDNKFVSKGGRGE